MVDEEEEEEEAKLECKKTLVEQVRMRGGDQESSRRDRVSGRRLRGKLPRRSCRQLWAAVAMTTGHRARPTEARNGHGGWAGCSDIVRPDHFGVYPCSFRGSVRGDVMSVSWWEDGVLENIPKLQHR
jgi:hypothetical protein